MCKACTQEFISLTKVAKFPQNLQPNYISESKKDQNSFGRVLHTFLDIIPSMVFFSHSQILQYTLCLNIEMVLS